MRRQTVLDYMLEQGYITQEAYDEAVADDVYSRIQETDSQTEETSIYTYYVDAMIDQIIPGSHGTEGLHRTAGQ